MSEKWIAGKERDRVSKRITWGIRKLDGSPSGHLIARDLTETNAELIVRALNHDELFDEMMKVMQRQVTHGINQCTCRWHPGRKCNACKRETLLTKIDKEAEGVSANDPRINY